jgi:hypothetical protein
MGNRTVVGKSGEQIVVPNRNAVVIPNPTTNQNDIIKNMPRHNGQGTKGLGYFGALPMQDGSGRVATEYSIGTRIGDRDMEIPSMVPTLNKEELNHILTGGTFKQGNPIADSIFKKAVEHAKYRISQGKNPFAEEGEQQQWGNLNELPENIQKSKVKNMVLAQGKDLTVNDLPTTDKLRWQQYNNMASALDINQPMAIRDWINAGKPVKDKEVKQAHGIKK